MPILVRRFPLRLVLPTLLAAGAALSADVARAQAPAIPASNVATRGVTLAEGDRAALVRNREGFEAAWARGDARALGALMAPEVVSGSGDGGMSAGRAAMERAYGGLFAGSMRGTTLAITVESQDAIRPDLTVSHGHYEIRRGAEVLVRNRYMTVHERTGGEWLIRSMQTFTPAEPR